MAGTPAAPQASGEAKVEAKTGGTGIELKVTGMPQPTALGAEFLTYVLWTVTPDGTTTNLGEITIGQNGEGKLIVKAQSQTFALIVTAEPYYAVHIPSELVVLTNETRKNTKGKIYPDNSYKLMRRSEYTKQGNPLALKPDLKKVPLEMYEARNAVEIAKSRGAEQYAPEVFSKAQSSLQSAENVLAQDSGKKKCFSSHEGDQCWRMPGPSPCDEKRRSASRKKKKRQQRPRPHRRKRKQTRRHLRKPIARRS
jgi:hypothetical protein